MPLYIVPRDTIEDIAEQRAEAAMNQIAQAVIDAGGEDIVPMVREFMTAIIVNQIIGAMHDVARRTETLPEPH